MIKNSMQCVSLIMILLTLIIPVNSQVNQVHQIVPYNAFMIGSDGYDYLTNSVNLGNSTYISGYFSYPIPSSRSLYSGPFYGDSEFIEFFKSDGFQSNTYGGGNDIPLVKVDDHLNITYSTAFGGGGDEQARDILPTPDGSILIVGQTTSQSFNGKGIPNNGQTDGFMLELDADNASIISIKILGGSNVDIINQVEFLDDGSMIVVGSTNSIDFPLVNAFDSNLTQYNDYLQTSDIFITKYRSNGSIEFSSYIGGSNYERIRAIEIDQENNIYLGGFTLSSDFPLVNAEDDGNFGNTDAFLVKLSQNGTVLKSINLGGNAIDAINDMKFSPNGDLVVVGTTFSHNFPISRAVSGVDRELNNKDSPVGSDGFYVIMNDDFEISISSYFGGSYSETLNSLDIDENGDIYITGSTKSPDFPIRGPFNRPPEYNGVLLDEAKNGVQITDMFIAKILSSGKIAYSTFFGGYNYDSGRDLKVMTVNNTRILRVTGYTNSPGISNIYSEYNAASLINSVVIDFEIPDGSFSLVSYPGPDNTNQIIMLSIFGGVSITLLGNYIYYRWKKKQADNLRYDKYRESYDLVKEAMKEDK